MATQEVNTAQVTKETLYDLTQEVLRRPEIRNRIREFVLARDEYFVAMNSVFQSTEELIPDVDKIKNKHEPKLEALLKEISDEGEQAVLARLGTIDG